LEVARWQRHCSYTKAKQTMEKNNDKKLYQAKGSYTLEIRCKANSNDAIAMREEDKEIN